MNSFSEEFVLLLTKLEERTEGKLQNLMSALDKYPDLHSTVDSLSEMWRAWEEHMRSSPNKRVVQAHPQFLTALRRYEDTWEDCGAIKFRWVLGPERAAAFDKSIDEILDAPLANTTRDEAWTFDPEFHSAAVEIGSAHEYIADRASDFAWFSRAAGAIEWFTGTVGLDYAEIENRWQEFPVLVIKSTVSNKHGLTEKKSLFTYLENIRRAYVVGADLAALAMCRSTTEIVIRRHYCGSNYEAGLNKKEIPLGPLLQQTVDVNPQLKKFNLEEKVREANQLMHFNRTYDAKKWENAQTLVRNWVVVLNDLIDLVPEQGSVEL